MPSSAVTYPAVEDGSDRRKYMAVSLLCTLSFPQPHPRAPAVLFDEFDASCLEGGADYRERGTPRLSPLDLKLTHRDDAHAGGVGELLLRPVEKATRGAALSG